MDIFKWVDDLLEEMYENGDQRMAYLIDNLPSLVNDDEHEQVDSVAAETLNYARSVKNPWLEVYIRHWHLQSKVFHRYEVKDLLGEAVSLVEFAHREETKACPQSVCAVQDLSHCYGLVDGPAYADQRLAVVEETLARIDASWPCFTCLTSEKTDALLDAGEPQKAMDFFEGQMSELVRAGYGSRVTDMHSTRVELLLALGRNDEALAYNTSVKGEVRDESSRREHTLDQALIEARLGDFKKSLKRLPGFEKVQGTHSLYRRWAETAFLQAMGGARPNDWELSCVFRTMSDELFGNGVVNKAIEIGAMAVELALARKMPVSAKIALDRIEAMVPSLKKQDAALGRVTALRGRVNSAGEISYAGELPPTPEAVIESLGTDPEQALALLEAARRSWPGDDALLAKTAEAWQVLGDESRAAGILAGRLSGGEFSTEIMIQLGFLHVNADNGGALEELFRSAEARFGADRVRVETLWLRAHWRLREGDLSTAAEDLEELLGIVPDAKNARHTVGRIYKELGEFEKALAHFDVLAKIAEESGDYDWDRMVVATVLKKWASVRDSSRRLGVELEGRGPVDGEFGACIVRFTNEFGDRSDYYALRTGPVTARVLEIASPDLEQHYGDTLVFEPYDLSHDQNEGVSADEDGDPLPVFHCFKIIKPGGYRSYVIEGVHPGKKALDALRAKLSDQGVDLNVVSDEDYTIENEKTGKEMKGLCAFLAAPKKFKVKDLAALLGKETKDYKKPLFYTDVLKAAGEKKALAEQEKAMEQYGL